MMDPAEMPSSNPSPVLLATIGFDLQIKICSFLHPSDILALRETCKLLQLLTRQRIIWIEALHRICIDNTLFLPSFPILDMSDVELEQAATAPHRWNRLCATFAKQNSDNSEAILYPIRIRNIRDPFATPDSSLADTQILLVPGGRYLVSYSPRGTCVWDLGYTPNASCELLASVGHPGGTSCIVNPTSDGMGLIIVAFRQRPENCSVYEIYPQSETPQLTQIANFPSGHTLAYLLPNKVIFHTSRENGIIFTVWDYRLNHSTCFFADIDDVEPSRYAVEIIATTTAIIVLRDKSIFVWAIPPLSVQPPDFSDHNPTHIPPLFKLAFPDDFSREITPYFNLPYYWNRISSWYSGTSQTLYFGFLSRLGILDVKFQDFEIALESDLSDVSLRVLNTCRPPQDNLSDVFFGQYGIGEDTLISCWKIHHSGRCRIHIRSLSGAGILPGGSIFLPVLLSATDIQMPSLCPASGRFVHLDIHNDRIGVVDFL